MPEPGVLPLRSLKRPARMNVCHAGFARGGSDQCASRVPAKMINWEQETRLVLEKQLERARVFLPDTTSSNEVWKGYVRLRLQTRKSGLSRERVLIRSQCISYPAKC